MPSVRVLILRSNPIAPDPRVEKIARALSQAGHSVTALGWDRTAALPSREVHDDFTVRRLPIRADFGSGLANLPNLLRWQIKLWRELARMRGGYDILHACDFDTILPALWAKWRWGKRVVYDIFDFYADHLRRTPAFLINLIRRTDLWAIGKADALILVDDARREQVAGSKPRRLFIIYNSPEDAGLTVQAETRPAGELRLAYIGLLQVERGLFEMLDVLARHPQWTLDLAGFGGDEDEIKRRAGAMANVRWHGRVPYEKAMELSHAADALFATYDPAIPNHRFSSANKVFEAMMLGKPLIAARNTNMDRMVEEADSGLVVEYGNTMQLENALEQLACDPAARARMGGNARQAYEERYSWSIMAQRLVDLYGEIETSAR